MSTTIGLKLEPLDVLFFRDGRPFGAATRGESDLPFPQTFAGAVWTALLDAHGCDFRRLAERLREGRMAPSAAIEAAGAPPWIAATRVRGPWLARQATAGGPFEVFVPAPAALHVDKTSPGADRPALHRLEPLPSGRLPGWQPPESAPGLWPLWLRHPSPTESATGYLTPDGLRAFLTGESVEPDQLLQPGDLYEKDHRTGIGIHPDRLSVEESLIYTASFLALKPEVALYGEVLLPDGVDRTVLHNIGALRFGGEGRRVRVQILNQPYRWPEQALPTGSQKPLVLLTTPGLFRQRWKPAVLNGCLLAAAVPGAVGVSGWDLARGGPKPNRFAVRAGSTYFLNEPLDPWPATLSDRDRDAEQGWGCYLKGVWNDERR